MAPEPYRRFRSVLKDIRPRSQRTRPDNLYQMLINLHHQCCYCAVTDTLAQQAYAARTDWDIAIADGRIRTNSGTSGPGDGGIAPSPYDYEHTEPDMPAIFQTDSIR